MPGDEFGVLDLSVPLFGDPVGQLVALAVGLIHAFQEPDPLSYGVKVLGRGILGPHAEFLELSDRGEDIVPDGLDALQEPLVRGRHNEEIYSADASRARDLARCILDPLALPYTLLAPAGEIAREPPRYAAVSDAGF